MGKGIKKISENVIADGRSLLLVSTIKTENNKVVPTAVNTAAMPEGMINVDFNNKGLIVKTSQGSKPSESIWSKLDAANTLLDSSISTALIADNAIVTSKIKDANITNDKIANDAITTAKIKNSNVTTDKIANDAIITNKIQNSAVTTAKIANNSITNSKLATDSVYGAAIKNGSITTEKIANYSITEYKIADGAIRTRHLFNGAVTTDKLADGAVTTSKIKDGAVTSSKIAPNQISTSHLQNGAVTLDKMASNSVGTAQLKDGSITKSKFAPGAIDLSCLDPSIVDIVNRAVVHDGKGNVTGSNNSTAINNLTATGDIYARRVYNVVYMDIAEGYIPGEMLEPGDIVAMHEDGKVYKANSLHECIVGVVSNEYAHCLGASKEELFSGKKVAVGMIGKIHVKVKGPVRLGQRLGVSLSEPGIGMASWINGGYNLGQVLETVDCDFDEIHTVLVQIRPM